MRLRLLAAAILLFGWTAASLGAGPVVSFDPDTSPVRLFHSADVGDGVSKQFVIAAKGAEAVVRVYGNVTGVLFQATAQPNDAIRSLPIDLAYTLKGDHDAVLRATVGNDDITSDAPAWIWAVAARFADHDATAAITMTDKPPTVAEMQFRQRWLANADPSERLLWVRYHPAVDDTLIGFFLFAADAMLANAHHMRNVTKGLRDLQRYSAYPTNLRPTESRRAARMLDGIIAMESQPGDCVMLNDVNEAFVFMTNNNQLRIAGRPNYHFSRRNASGEFTDLRKLTDIIDKNRQIVADVNPLIGATVADFAQHVAFFNHIQETNPDEFDAFIRSLPPVFACIPATETPIAVAIPAR